MPRIAIIETLIRQTVEIPEGADKQEVLNFLAEYQSFGDAFIGLTNGDETMRLVAVQVIEEDVEEIEESEDA
jgi:hypothetical protein